ncbi:hypothetical protein PV10_06694 [Exophiala mesophila]|uniref:Uncharacterized protein n=1 Tax=Exophiala mesophila TaxID=212818 RepID=A0A0D1XVC7_EXOME|nr:uncharacterized protein PV10_06694 [Exophiala mesophila]KIV92236.1 hypothetical protein PV10_06694 [Exophiala mesophila]
MPPASAQRAQLNRLLHNLHLKIDYRRIWRITPHNPPSKNVLIDAVTYITSLKQHDLIRIDRGKVSYAELMHRLGELIDLEPPSEEQEGLEPGEIQEGKQDQAWADGSFASDCLILKTAGSYIDNLIKTKAGTRGYASMTPKGRPKPKRFLSPTLDLMEPQVKRWRPTLEERVISSDAAQKDGEQMVAKTRDKKQTGPAESPDLELVTRMTDKKQCEATKSQDLAAIVEKDPLGHTLDKIDAWAEKWLAGKLQEKDWDQFEKCVE